MRFLAFSILYGIMCIVFLCTSKLTFLCSCHQITKELSRLQQLALANKLSPDDISGGTITLSNIGAIGGKFGSPLVNSPEVAIIAIGRVKKTPCLDDDGNVYPVSVMTVSKNFKYGASFFLY